MAQHLLQNGTRAVRFTTQMYNNGIIQIMAIDLQPLPREYLSKIRMFSSQLEKCISGITIENGLYGNNDFAAEVASACYLSMYGTD